jgi:hypothetical protein
MNFFDFLNSVNQTKEDLLKNNPLNEKDYSAFMINRGLSYFHDTIMYANEMNRSSDIPKKWQYDFYLHGLSKRKRFAKWQKKEAFGDDHIVHIIVKEYNYSLPRALEALDILSDDQKNDLIAKYQIGGKGKSYK